MSQNSYIVNDCNLAFTTIDFEDQKFIQSFAEYLVMDRMVWKIQDNITTFPCIVPLWRLDLA